MQGWPLSALRKATPSNSPLLPSMHCTGNFILEFPSINSPVLTLTHARAAKLVVCSTDLSYLAAWVISFWNFLADDKFGGAHMRHCENRRVYGRKFQNEITRRNACWAGEVSSKGSRIGCQCCPCGWHTRPHAPNALWVLLGEPV